MHYRTSWIIAFLAILFLVPGGMAFTISPVSVVPEIMNPGDPVNVSYTVYAASGTAFSSYDSLQFVTGLGDPVWSYTIIVNGVENVRPADKGNTLSITGYELSYEDQDEVTVKMVLRGRVPATAATGTDIPLLTVQELDSRNRVISYSVVRVTHLVGLPTPTPTPAYGRIVITSEPSGANVYVDNVIRGISPMTVDNVPNGDHTVRLRLDGYEDYSRDITVMADAQQVNAALTGKSGSAVTAHTTTAQTTVTAAGVTAIPQPAQQAGTGSLSVTTSPPGALVYIDGKMKGVTPATIPGLSPGTHTIRIIMDGYQDLETTTEITAGTTSEFVTGLSKGKQLSGFIGLFALAAVGLLMVARDRRRENR